MINRLSRNKLSNHTHDVTCGVISCKLFVITASRHFRLFFNRKRVLSFLNLFSSSHRNKCKILEDLLTAVELYATSRIILNFHLRYHGAHKSFYISEHTKTESEYL